MRLPRVAAGLVLATALALPAPASAAVVCTVYWRDVVTAGPVTVRYPYCIW